MRWMIPGLMLVLVVGCGPREPVPVAVTGTIMLDKKPLAEGKISFITNGKVPEVLDVQKGRYEGKVLPGERRVEIAVYRPYQIPADVPKSMHSMMEGGKENALPDRYHRNSTLSATVKESGVNTFDFDLSSAKE